MNKAVFLDRDGTINAERSYIHQISDFQFLPGAVEAIRLLNHKGYRVIVVTNQSGVARGFYEERDVDALHDWMMGELKSRDAYLDAIYYCPHHEEGVGKYRRACDCRKPKPGMIERGLRELGIDPRLSYMIGDKESDILAGKSAGTRTILVRTGYGKGLPARIADQTAADLLEAVQRHIP